jgi:D-alanine transaminase
MQKLTYFNGDFIKHEDVKVHIDDRGYIFGDGIYELMEFYENRYIDGEWHYERFIRTCGLVGFEIEGSLLPLKSYKEFCDFCDVLRLKNTHLNLQKGFVFIQVTRGHLGLRMHNAPKTSKELSIIATINNPVIIQDWWMEKGLSCITFPDIRWQRRDIKSLQLLANVMAKQKALDEGCDDAIFIDNGTVTEATAANAFIVKNGILKTHPATNKILWGITRLRIFEICKFYEYQVQEVSFTQDDLYNADEVFLSNSNSHIRPVTKIDGKIIGDGSVGKISKILFDCYEHFSKTGQYK